MKKIVSLLTVIAMLVSGIVITSADEVIDLSNFNYDFNSYTTTLPSGITGTASSASLDSMHGVSLKAGASIKLKLPTELKTGIYRLSYDMAIDAKKTITVRAMSTEYEGHYLMYIHANKIDISGDTGKNKWNFTNYCEYEALKWYRFDYIIDMQGNVVMYIDGKKAGETKVSFNDLKGFDFLGEGNGSYYLDNLKFEIYNADVTSEGVIDSPVWLIGKNQSEVAFTFSETLNAESIDKSSIKAYSLGTNPVEYVKNEVAFELAEKNANNVVIKFTEALVPGAGYKVEFTGAKSIFDKPYKNNDAYFSVEGNLKEIDVLYDDFTGITQPQWAVNAGNWMYVPVIPTGKKDADKWNWGGTCRAYPCWEDKDNKITAVEFMPTKGEAAAPVAECQLAKAMPQTMKNRAEIEFEVKIKTIGTFCVIAVDSKNITTRLLEFKDTGLNTLYGADYTKSVMDIPLDKYIKIKLDIDLANGVYDVYADGVKLTEEPVTLSSANYGGNGAHATDIAKIRFSQYNRNRYDSPDNTEETWANTFLRYVKAKSFANVPSVGQVYFMDNTGIKSYPDGGVTSQAEKMVVLFSGEIDGETLTGNISLANTQSGEVIVPEGTFDNKNGIYTLDLPNYLAGGGEYAVTISESIADKSGETLASAINGKLKVGTGKFEVNNLSLDIADNKVNVSVKVTHTDKSLPSFYIIYAGYQGTKMKGFDFKEIKLTDLQRKVETTESFTIENISEFERVKGFVWDGFDTLIPLFDFDEKEISAIN